MKRDENRHPLVHGVRLMEDQHRPVCPPGRERFRFARLPPAPDCVGTFEREHPQCTGDPQASDPEARLPCIWRRYCRGIKRYLLHPETAETLAELRNRTSKEELALQGERWASRPPHRVRATKRGSRKRGPARKLRHVGRAAPIHPVLQHTSRVFRDHLVKALPEAKIQAASSCKVLAAEGIFYEQMGFGAAGSRVLKWFYSRGTRAPVCAWRIRAVMDDLISVELPCGLRAVRDTLGEERAHRLALYSTANNMGRWGAQLYGLSVGLMGEAAEAVAELLRARQLTSVPWPPERRPPTKNRWFLGQMSQEQARTRRKRKKAAQKKERQRKKRGY